MITKCLEVRDEATCIPVLAIKMVSASPIEHTYLWRCGYPRDGMTGTPAVVVMNLNNQRASSDPYDRVWDGNNTMRNAHDYIYEHFDELTEGQVVDVRVIRGEQESPAEPEIWV